jgi:hypothetical protein
VSWFVLVLDGRKERKLPVKEDGFFVHSAAVAGLPLRLNDWNVWNDWNRVFLPTRRKWTHIRDRCKSFNYVRVPWKIRDQFLLILRHQRGRLDSE